MYSKKFRYGLCFFALLAMAIVMFAPQIFAQQGLQNGLVAYYPFDGDANDESGNNNHGVVKGGITYADGMLGQAVKLNGTNSYIRVANPSQKFNAQFTITAWVLTEGRGGCLFSKYSWNTYTGRGIGLSFTTPDGNGWVSSGSTLFSGTLFDTGWYPSNYPSYTMPVNKFEYISAVYNSGNIKIYINGAVVAEKTIQHGITLDNSYDMLIGTYFDNYGTRIVQTWTGRTFAGLTDELRIYNRALSEGEIKELYTVSSGLTQANAEDACTQAADIRTVKSGNWNDPSVWDTGTVPANGDFVAVEYGHIITVPDSVDLGDGGICNKGTIQSGDNPYGKPSGKIEIHAASIHNSGDIIGKNGKNGICQTTYGSRYVCKKRWFFWKRCWWERVLTGLNIQRATSGSSIEIHSTLFINDVSGKIQSGSGGNDIQTCRDRNPSRGGAGGKAEIFSYSFLNEGIIQSGNGGNAESYHTTSFGGNGGDILVISNLSDPDNISKNIGFFISGNGGYSRTQSGYSYGSKGGDLDLFIRQLGGTIKGSSGSRLWWDPFNIEFLKGLTIEDFKSVTIYTDAGGTIDVGGLIESGTISAEEITIATQMLNGQGGTLDLRGLTERVFNADTQLKIYADEILADEGINLEDILGSNFTVSPGMTLSRVAISSEEQFIGIRGQR